MPATNMRLLGLDVGEKTIGTAVTDDAGLIAFPRETIRRQDGWRRDMAALRALVDANQIGGIVVGQPLMMDGRAGVQAQKVADFVAVLRRSVRVPIIMQDERLSTREADRLLMEANRTREERKKVVDSVAACLILQSYIDSQRNQRDLDDIEAESAPNTSHTQVTFEDEVSV